MSENDRPQLSRDGFRKLRKDPSQLGKKVKRFHQKMKNVKPEDLPGMGWQTILFFYRFVILLYEGVYHTELARRASSLTYTTILSIFPMLAIVSFVLSYSYTSENEEQVIEWIQDRFLPTVESRSLENMTESEIETYAQQREFVENIQAMFLDASEEFRRGASRAGIIGLFGLLLTAGILYYSIESVVNQTWRTSHRQRWTKTITNYVTALVFIPIIIGLSIAGSTFALVLLAAPEEAERAGQTLPLGRSFDEDMLTTASLKTDTEPLVEVNEVLETATNPTAAEATPKLDSNAPESAATAEASDESKSLPGWILLVRKFTRYFGFTAPAIPAFINALILAVAFSFIPGTRVYFRYAFLGALIATILWEVARLLFFKYVALSFVNRTLTDLLGVTVIFLIWIYITWLILLLGNLIVYTSQNFTQLWQEKLLGEQVLLDGRLLVAIMVMLAAKFEKQGGGYEEFDLRLRLGLSPEDFDRLLEPLMKKGYVTHMGSTGYQIGRAPEKITVRNVMELGCDVERLPVCLRSKSRVTRAMQQLQEKTINLMGNVTLADLVQRPGDSEEILKPLPE